MTAPVKRYNMDVGKFGNVDAYESEHGRWVKRDDFDRLEQERDAIKAASLMLGRDLADALKQVEAMRQALLFGCKALAQMTSSDGSGHADIALSALRIAGVDQAERERMVEEWKSTVRWRLETALQPKP